MFKKLFFTLLFLALFLVGCTDTTSSTNTNFIDSITKELNTTADVPSDSNTTKPKVERIEFKEKDVTLNVNESIELHIDIYPLDAEIDMNKLSINISDEYQDYISVDGYVITALKAGTVELTCSYNNELSANLTVTIVDTINPDNLTKNNHLEYASKSLDGTVEYPNSNYTKDDIEDILSSLNIMLFPTTTILNISFGEYEISLKDKNDKLYAILGIYESRSDSIIFHDPHTYYDGLNDEFSHNYHISEFSVPMLIPTSITYDSDDDTYSMSTYLSFNLNRTELVMKGNISLNRIDTSPTHLVDVDKDNHDDNYEKLIENTTFDFNNVTVTYKNNEYGNEELISYNSNSHMTFFTENEFELVIYGLIKQNVNPYTELFYRGTYKIYKLDDNSYEITIVVNEGYVDGVRTEYFSSKLSENNIVYNNSENSISFKMVDENGELSYSFNKSNKESIKTNPVSFDNWDSTKLEEVLTELEYTVSIPKMEYVKDFEIKKKEDSKEFYIYATLTYINNNSFDFFLDSLENNYMIRYLELGQYRLSNDYSTELHYELFDDGDYTVVKLTIKPHEVPYQSEDIQNLYTSYSPNETALDFRINIAERYEYSSNVLYIYTMPDSSFDSIKEEIVTRAKNNGYTEFDNKGTIIYLSSTKNIAFSISSVSTNDELTTIISLIGGDTLPIPKYPIDKIESYLANLTDKFPDMSSDEATQYEYTSAFTYVFQYCSDLNVYLTKESDVETIVSNLKQRLLDNDYFIDSVEIVFTPEGRTPETRNVFEMYISKNKEIGVEVIAYVYDPTYTQTAYYLVNIYNLKSYDSVKLQSENN